MHPSGHFETKVEITDFDPEKDQLVLPTEAFFRLKLDTEFDDYHGGDIYDRPVEDVAIETDPDGAYTDIVFYADFADTEIGETMRIRLWGVDDFDPYLLKHGSLDSHDPEGTGLVDAANINFQNLQFTSGTETQLLDESMLVGQVAPESILLNDAHNSTVMSGAGDDTISGAGGNLTIYGNEGNDQLALSGFKIIASGEDGDDHLIGDGTKIKLYGKFGNDTIEGSGSDLVLGGGEGNDILIATGENILADGHDGDDQITVNGDNTSVNGGGGSDVITVSGDHVSAYGDTGNDTLTHTGGPDENTTLDGGDGDDTLTGTLGDTLNGGEGHDLITIDVDSFPDSRFDANAPNPATVFATPNEDQVHFDIDEGTGGELFVVESYVIDQDAEGQPRQRVLSVHFEGSVAPYKLTSVATLHIPGDYGQDGDGFDPSSAPKLDITGFITSSAPISSS